MSCDAPGGPFPDADQHGEGGQEQRTRLWHEDELGTGAGALPFPGARHVCERHEWRRIAEQLEAVLHRLIGGELVEKEREPAVL